MAVTWFHYSVLLSLPDGELHTADGDHQGLLHGLLLPGRQAARLALHQEPLQHGLPEALREVLLRSCPARGPRDHVRSGPLTLYLSLFSVLFSAATASQESTK